MAQALHLHGALVAQIGSNVLTFEAADRTTAGTLVIGGANTEILNLATDQVTSVINVGTTQPLVGGRAINVGCGPDWTNILLDGHVTIEGDVTIKGTEDVLGNSTFAEDVTLGNNVDDVISVAGTLNFVVGSEPGATLTGRFGSNLPLSTGTKSIYFPADATGGGSIQLQAEQNAAGAGGDIVLTTGSGTTSSGNVVFGRTAGTAAADFQILADTNHATEAGIRYNPVLDQWELRADGAPGWTPISAGGSLPTGTVDQLLQCVTGTTWVAASDVYMKWEAGVPRLLTVRAPTAANTNGGNIALTGGLATGTGAGGSTYMEGAATAGSGAAGSVVIAGGLSNSTGITGSVNILGGQAYLDGIGGAVGIYAGIGAGTSAGADVIINSANAVGIDQNGGRIYLTLGAPTNSGVEGYVLLGSATHEDPTIAFLSSTYSAPTPTTGPGFRYNSNEDRMEYKDNPVAAWLPFAAGGGAVIDPGTKEYEILRWDHGNTKWVPARDLVLPEGAGRAVTVQQNATGNGDYLLVRAGAASALEVFDGGDLLLMSGSPSGSGISGDVTMSSSASAAAGGNTGNVNITTGGAHATSGHVTVATGSGATQSGDVRIAAGSTIGTVGSVRMYRPVALVNDTASLYARVDLASGGTSGYTGAGNWTDGSRFYDSDGVGMVWASSPGSTWRIIAEDSDTGAGTNMALQAGAGGTTYGGSLSLNGGSASVLNQLGGDVLIQGGNSGGGTGGAGIPRLIPGAGAGARVEVGSTDAGVVSTYLGFVNAALTGGLDGPGFRLNGAVPQMEFCNDDSGNWQPFAAGGGAFVNDGTNIYDHLEWNTGTSQWDPNVNITLNGNVGGGRIIKIEDISSGASLAQGLVLVGCRHTNGAGGTTACTGGQGSTNGGGLYLRGGIGSAGQGGEVVVSAGTSGAAGANVSISASDGVDANAGGIIYLRPGATGSGTAGYGVFGSPMIASPSLLFQSVDYSAPTPTTGPGFRYNGTEDRMEYKDNLAASWEPFAAGAFVHDGDNRYDHLEWNTTTSEWDPNVDIILNGTFGFSRTIKIDDVAAPGGALPLSILGGLNTAGAGGNLNLWAGEGSTTGGDLYVRAGEGGAGKGGNFTASAGNSVGAVGGDATLQATSGNGGNFKGGDTYVNSGAGGGNALGGTVYIEAGSGGFTAGMGGDLRFTAGPGGTGSFGGDGGRVEILAGETTAGTGGDILLRGGPATTGVGGSAFLYAGGNTAGRSGSVYIGSYKTEFVVIGQTNLWTLTVATGLLSPNGTANISLPNNASARFQIEGTSVTSTAITAPNMDRLFNGSTLASTGDLHYHASVGSSAAVDVPVAVDAGANGDVVYIAASDTIAVAQANVATAARAAGVRVAANTVRVMGVATGVVVQNGVVVAAGDDLYLSATSAGDVTNVAPTGATQYMTYVGQAKTGATGPATISMYVRCERPIAL